MRRLVCTFIKIFILKLNHSIEEVNSDHGTMIKAFIAGKWGSSISVSKGRVFDTVDLPGFICTDDNKVIGLITYFIDDQGCEIVTLNSEQEGQGLAEALINQVIEKAKSSHCERVWLITSNDNSHAIRYYQRRGFEWIAFYKDAMTEARKIKPEIAEIGYNDIPIKHELEFELKL